MLKFFKSLSQGRFAWLLLATSCAILEATALYFQHGMGLKPCVMCVYERIALLGIMVAALFGAFAPRSTIIRWIALILGLFSATKGLMLALKHTDYQLHPAPWNQCSPFVDFPETLPLNQWFPNIFEATSLDCAKITWTFLELTMPQWLIVVFAIYIAILSIVTLSQFSHTSRTHHRHLFH